MENNRKIPALMVLISAILIISNIPGANIRGPSAQGQALNQYYFPLIVQQHFSLTSTSYYMTTINPGFIYNLGCQLGTRDKNTAGAQDSVAVLAFGYPRCLDGGGFGANLFGYGPVSTFAVGTAIKQFAMGYYTCTGADNESNLVIGVGTSNYIGPREACMTPDQATTHGKAWSAMVTEINQWAVSQGIFHQVQAYGANNIEVGWNSPEWSRAWITGFDEVPGNYMLHFGDAAGCPYEDNPHWSCGTSTYPEWTLADVWYVSYGAPSVLPLPLIYLTSGVHAKQWAYLSQYSLTKHGDRMDFTGVFTQWAYCQQFGWCNQTDNTPEQAYQQLTSELHKSPGTSQNLRWKTDIRWIMQNEITSAALQNEGIQNGSFSHPLQEQVNLFESVLQSSALNTGFRVSLETKQAIAQNMSEMITISKMNPAPKDTRFSVLSHEPTEIKFETGIFTKGEVPGIPYGVEIINTWQNLTETGYLQIAAGSSPGDEHNGALYIILTTPDHTSHQVEMIPAPLGCGPLSILGEGDDLLHIQSSQGCNFILDIQAWVLTPITD